MQWAYPCSAVRGAISSDQLHPTSGVCLEQVTHFRSEASVLWWQCDVLSQDTLLILQTLSRTATQCNWLQLKCNFINCLLPSLLEHTSLLFDTPASYLSQKKIIWKFLIWFFHLVRVGVCCHAGCHELWRVMTRCHAHSCNVTLRHSVSHHNHHQAE